MESAIRKRISIRKAVVTFYLLFFPLWLVSSHVPYQITTSL